MIKLVVALGNPGREYEFTRHNIGWLVMDEIGHCKSGIWKTKFKGEYTDASINGEKIFFLKPQTFMNLSGESVAALAKFFKIQVTEILVLQDELDLPFGQLAFKKGGGLAGHNGLKSMAKCLGSQDFHRLRIGIGRPLHGSVSDWVLSSFYDVSDTEVELVLNGSVKAVEDVLKVGFDKAAGKNSKKNLLSLN
jgi:PTH1 family peptidyl-tRNA hydrolase